MSSAKLKYVGKILSDDGLLRIISWNYPLKMAIGDIIPFFF